MAFETSRADQPADPPYPTTDRFALSPERRADRARRTPTLLLRRTSTMSLWARVDLQVERDALVHRLARIDRRLSVLTDERLAIVAELAQIRDDLYPVVHWCHGRRPPDVDRAPLPPAPAGARPLRGRSLRAAGLAILRRHGRLPLREIHALLHRYGYLVEAPFPTKALADALGHEADIGRARRVERGVYEAMPLPIDPGAAGLDLPPPSAWGPDGPTPLDEPLDEDPSTWTPRASADVDR